MSKDLIERAEAIPTIDAVQTLTKLIDGEWVDTDEVQAAFGIDFKAGMKLFELSRMAEWNAAPLNGQKITTKFRMKSAPVRHGRWENMGFMAIQCSGCKDIFYELGNTNYCPNCGAKMEVDHD